MAVPRYLTIAADLRSKIEAGTLRPGTQLPPEQNLQDEYGRLFSLSGAVSRNIVRDAIEVLAREGLVEKRRGQGTFIVGKIDLFVNAAAALSVGAAIGPFPREAAKIPVTRSVRHLPAQPKMRLSPGIR